MILEVSHSPSSSTRGNSQTNPKQQSKLTEDESIWVKSQDISGQPTQTTFLLPVPVVILLQCLQKPLNHILEVPRPERRESHVWGGRGFARRLGVVQEEGPVGLDLHQLSRACELSPVNHALGVTNCSTSSMNSKASSRLPRGESKLLHPNLSIYKGSLKFSLLDQ